MSKILLVDDAAFMRMMLKDILSKAGYDPIVEAENGLVAVEKYKEETPDLVIMDITITIACCPIAEHIIMFAPFASFLISLTA